MNLKFNILKRTPYTHLEPITRRWLNNFPILQSDDIRKDKAWAFTTIATTGNDELLAITRTEVKRFSMIC